MCVFVYEQENKIDGTVDHVYGKKQPEHPSSFLAPHVALLYCFNVAPMDPKTFTYIPLYKWKFGATAVAGQLSAYLWTDLHIIWCPTIISPRKIK